MAGLAFHRITSLLDNDFYNFTMGQIAYKHFPDMKVKYAFTNRTISARLADIIPVEQLREEIANIQSMKLTPFDIAYLRSQGLFDDDYLEALTRLTMPMPEVEVVDGQFIIQYEGTWWESVLWETPLLALVNQLYYWNSVKGTLNAAYMEGVRRLDGTIDRLRDCPDVKFIEFGTRRRFDGNWQAQVFSRLLEDVPAQVVGTSNVWLAKEFDVTPSGTMAHQLMMIIGAYTLSVGGTLELAQDTALDLWENQYRDKRDGKLLVALTDTWGTDFFLRKVKPERMEKWYGMRQDSGNPFLMAYKMIGWYKKAGIPTEGHVHIPSDGLTDDTMCRLTKSFGQYMSVVHGCGTFLTNNVGYDPISIVVKPVLVNGSLPTVKLSDNIAKAIGPASMIERYKKLVAYDNEFTEQPIY